ncbi:bacterioferritin-associated ferredoxin [Streptomyces caeni]|uniref:Bacterioferritin-associated ferredoxin n=1 Tax=Streptomyces caeni TaxID=2307231 RepID=A0ABW4INR6_9ACTN
MNRVYVCTCFAVTEAQVRRYAEDGARTPRQIASACKAGTDCGSCVRRIQALLGRDSVPRRAAVGGIGPVLSAQDRSGAPSGLEEAA